MDKTLQDSRRAATPIRFLVFTLVVLAGLQTVSILTYAQRQGSDRDSWQRPQDVMDVLDLHEGSRVADVGAGRGYFTFHLAQRVGAEGTVYAVDIDQGDLERIQRRAERDSLPQIVTVHGETDDPKLEAESVDAVLVVNAYHEFRQYNEMMQGMFKALRSGGLLAIIDSSTERDETRQRYYRRHDIPRDVVKEDAERNGFQFLREERGFDRPRGDDFYFLLFQKP